MTTLQALASGFGIVMDPVALLLILLACLIGVTVGIIPALGGMVIASLAIPFVWRMDAGLALPFLVSLVAVVYTGGSITTILLGVPGTAPNAATLIDGYPMAQKGKAGVAVGAAVTSSALGGTLPVFLSLLIIPVIRPIVLAFNAPEMFVLILLGLAFIAVLSNEGARLKGMICGTLGLLLSTVGFYGTSGEYRFTYGISGLIGGLDVVAIALGLFAVAEMFDTLIAGKSAIAGNAKTMGVKDVVEGIKMVWKHKWLWFRSTLIGYFCGLLPGVGGDVAMYMAYSQAKLTSKHPQDFGTGVVEGVIAPESANNAKDAGALLTTLSFGIPGSAVYSILMAGFLMVGITPGPKLVTNSLDMLFALEIGLALANIVAGLICLIAAPKLIKLSTVSVDFMFPAVIVLVCVGCYVTNISFSDVITAVIFGIIGFVMKRMDYSRPALLLGFVLGSQFETYFWRGFKLNGPLFWATPIGLVMIGMIVLIFFAPMVKKGVVKARGKGAR